MFKIKKETASMLTKDGKRLDADIYYPESSEKFPVLLMRQPYGREIASTVVYAHPRWYAAQGYIVVIQDVRGRGTSEGKFELFANEIDDGLDTINWVAQLPGSTGNVGMYGFSYQGMTQLYAAAKKPPALKTICPAMIAYDLYDDWAYEGGALHLHSKLAWATQLAAETARLQGDEKAYNILYQASRDVPFYNPSSSFIESLKKYAPNNFYFQWLNNPQSDQSWRKLSPKEFSSDMDLPMLHIGGWFDTYLRGNLKLYQQMIKTSQKPQYLIIGPWSHIPWSSKLGAIDYGVQANSPVDGIQIEWFNYFLKGIDSELVGHKPPIMLFEMGSNQWRYFDIYPTPNQQFYYLNSNGLANIRNDDGRLETQPANYSEDILVHDPWRPVPALGGHASIPAGSFDHSNLDCRSDILKYTSQPLEKDLYLAGIPTVEISLKTIAISFDLCAILSDVHPNGNVYNFSQGYIRNNLALKDSNNELLSELVTIYLQATCIKIPQNHCLRLSLSAACFPTHPINLGIDQLMSKNRLMDAQIITLIVTCNDNHLSQICLPITNN